MNEWTANMEDSIIVYYLTFARIHLELVGGMYVLFFNFLQLSWMIAFWEIGQSGRLLIFRSKRQLKLA